MTDWQPDARPFDETLAAWIAMHGWSQAEAARQLRVPYLTLRRWLPPAMRKCALEGAVRRLMTEIDRR